MPRARSSLIGLRRHPLANLSCRAPHAEWRIVPSISDGSTGSTKVRCLRCGTVWRTKAAYLARLARDKGSP